MKKIALKRILFYCFFLYTFIGQAQSLNLKLILVADGLNGPVAMASPRDQSKRIFVCEQIGKIRLIKNGVLDKNVVLDISSKIDKSNPAYSEKGLLGIAFHPEFKTNHRFFIYYSSSSQNKSVQHKSVISEYKMIPGSDVADPKSEKIIMEIDQPESNHNGGHLAFGPDGFLYIGSGDGGGAGDEHGTIGNGQNLQTHLGKILRIDVDHGSPYSIPDDNPFAKSANAKKEIWAYGLRNPWRFSFDVVTKRLFCGDVGQNKWEEINLIEKGKNYGWKITEGNHCFSPEIGCSRAGLSFPIIEYGREQGISVIGGFVYRGTKNPSFYGTYIFGDWKGKMYYAKETKGNFDLKEFSIEGRKDNDSGLFINSFGEDEQGEIYMLAQKVMGTVVKSGGIYLINNP